ncbi:MAG: FG-GAP-like repeat-containing protein [Actinobacteria bacterium]|nr:FG-GAP-like repeat-containing protein [Actinomycetota bacterium]MCA1702418.1 FG-GAP-like repeat-containing protein [Actinomycetota bacterium]
MATRMLAFAALSSGALVVGTSQAFSSMPDTRYEASIVDAPEPQQEARFAERSAAAGDLDGDRVADVFVSAFQLDALGVRRAGRVYLLSGRTRAVIRAIDSPEPQLDARFGNFLSVPGDVSGDGKADLAVSSDVQDVYVGSGTPCGAPEPNGCNENQGRVWLFSGATGALLRALDNPVPQANPGEIFRGVFGFGAGIGSAGDLTGDGRPELIVGAPANDAPTAGCGDTTPLPPDCRKDQGQAFIFNGATGVLLRALDIPPEDALPASCTTAAPPGGPGTTFCGFFGIYAQTPGDTDGDGITDQLVAAGSYNERRGRIYLFSGRTGAVLRKIDSPEPQSGAAFGIQDTIPLSPGDVNGDGSADIFGHGFQQNGPSAPAEGRAWVFDGKTGAVIYELRDPTPEVSGQFGFSLATTDYNRDGTPDLYVGQNPHRLPAGSQSGGAYIFDGPTGALLKAFELPQAEVQPFAPPANNGPRLGRSVAAPGDLNGDGEPDYVAGAPQIDVGQNQDQGKLLFFLSRTEPGGRRPAAPGPRTGLSQGACANEKRGTAAGETINGTALGDRLLGVGGNDRLNGFQGADCLYGGEGRDRLTGAAGQDRLAGAAGADTVRAGEGRDRLSGGRGNDRLSGGSGGDRLSSGPGRDRLSGARGNDRLSGGSGNDRLSGGQGRDRLSGGSGNDMINSNDRKRETVLCGPGRDVVRADRSDRLRGCERVTQPRRSKSKGD